MIYCSLLLSNAAHFQAIQHLNNKSSYQIIDCWVSISQDSSSTVISFVLQLFLLRLQNFGWGSCFQLKFFTLALYPANQYLDFSFSSWSPDGSDAMNVTRCFGLNGGMYTIVGSGSGSTVLAIRDSFYLSSLLFSCSLDGSYTPTKQKEKGKLVLLNLRIPLSIDESIANSTICVLFDANIVKRSSNDLPIKKAKYRLWFQRLTNPPLTTFAVQIVIFTSLRVSLLAPSGEFIDWLRL